MLSRSCLMPSQASMRVSHCYVLMAIIVLLCSNGYSCYAVMAILCINCPSHNTAHNFSISDLISTTLWYGAVIYTTGHLYNGEDISIDTWSECVITSSNLYYISYVMRYVSEASRSYASRSAYGLLGTYFFSVTSNQLMTYDSGILLAKYMLSKTG